VRSVLQKEPSARLENASLDDVAPLHKTAHSQLMDFVATANEEALSRKHVFGTGSQASSRKMLTQAALHSVHHWAQVAMEVRRRVSQLKNLRTSLSRMLWNNY